MSGRDLALNGKILVVDDGMENIRVLHHILQGQHKVIFAMDGMKALEMARTQAPELILLDAVMPGMDGYAVCAELQKSPETQDIPVIFVTVLSMTEDETRALEAGAVDFIHKPVNGAVVRARVNTHLTLKRQSDLLREMTMTDALTEVANRRCFDDILEREWKRCERAGLPLGLIMCDIDYFKRFNDRYGHPEGDRCLKAVAQALECCVRRPPDLVARYGGEEFAVLLPHEDLDGTKVVAQRILGAVQNLAIPNESSPCAPIVTISLGMQALIPSRDLSAEELINNADASLYRAKTLGRNRCCIWEA